MVVYDVGNKDSFEHVQSWFERVRQLGGEDIVTVLVGNKNDIELTSRQVSSSEGEEAAKKMARMGKEDSIVPHVETSALNGSNVEASSVIFSPCILGLVIQDMFFQSAFITMAQEIKRSVDRRGLSGIQLNSAAVQKTGGVQLASTERKASISTKCGCGM